MKLMLLFYLNYINISDLLTDILDKNGISILSIFSLGKIINQIVESLSPNVREKMV
jgi:hypothetical protein